MSGREIQEYTPKNKTGADVWYQISPSLIPSQIVDAVKTAPLKDVFSVTDDVTLSTQVLRCKSLVFNAKGRLIWAFPDVSNLGGFIALAADRLVFNAPNQLNELAQLVLQPPVTSPELRGTNGQPGAQGWMSGQADGTDGHKGNPGNRGADGGTFDYPTVLIFYNEIAINVANPSIVPAARLIGQGLAGGEGGTGGKGGQGGHGATGTGGERDCLLGVCVCSGGPGAGRNGGDGGPGGRGGDGGRGGNGSTFVFVGAASQTTKIEKLEFSVLGGKAGHYGQPGAPGVGGLGGGGGSKPFECIRGGDPGDDGHPANPPSLGRGDVKADGIDGSIMLAIRDNHDLFT
ncbi:hypothetical protein [Achromobacter mucicolens]|uniref:hypothetical protein n=1 Tax=Achromobacter mucicolens TaxID=1389922 RepID=UPI00244B2872|nr:hypothetical protein [Achromobacter mucicolens]MDH1522178.1 hypothetical protein [Achromobacter mucicolens]